VRDAAGHRYTLPDGFRLGAGKQAIIHTGDGTSYTTSASTHLYWGREWYMWNNTGDKVILRRVDKERVWRRWLTLNARLSATLQRELHDDAGLSMPDYEVLVHLTDSPAGRVRVTDLARLLQWERSRVSHHVTPLHGDLTQPPL
jgi:hypothetical protein